MLRRTVAALRDHVVAGDGRAAAGRVHERAQDADGRRLARAVGPEEPERLARRDLEVDARDRLHLAVALLEIAHDRPPARWPATRRRRCPIVVMHGRVPRKSWDIPTIGNHPLRSCHDAYRRRAGGAAPPGPARERHHHAVADLPPHVQGAHGERDLGRPKAGLRAAVLQRAHLDRPARAGVAEARERPDRPRPVRHRHRGRHPRAGRLRRPPPRPRRPAPLLAQSHARRPQGAPPSRCGRGRGAGRRCSRP